MTLIAGITALFLPETLCSPMPQTVEQVEAWHEDYGVPCRRKEALTEAIDIELKDGEEKEEFI